MNATYRTIQKFTLPLIANNLLQLLINQLILFIAVNKSLDSLAGITTIQSFLYALAGILGAVALAFNIAGGQALGKDDMPHFLEFLKSSLFIDLVVGLIFVLITLGAGELILTLIYGFRGALLTTASIYLLVQSPYILLTLLGFLSSNLIKIENKTSVIMVIALVATAAEILLNLLLVRVLKLGIVGASISSIVALLLTVFLQFFIVRKRVRLALKSKASAVKQLLKKAVPIGGQELLEGVIFVIVFEALIARLGVTTLALYGLCAQALTIVKMPTYMYENAITIFSSKAHGRKDTEEMKRIFKITLLSSSAFYLIFSLIIGVNARTFAGLFQAGLFVEKFPSYLLIVLISSIFFVSYENLKGILQSMNNEKYVLRRAFIVNLVLFLIMLAGKILGIVTFAFLYILYGTSLAILTLILFRKYHQLL